MSQACAHMAFTCQVNVARIEDLGRFMAEIEIRCTDCNTRFQFVGPEMGMSYLEPMVSVDRFELRAPIEPNAHMTSMMSEVTHG